MRSLRCRLARMRRRGAARQGRWSPGEYRFMAHASWQWGVNPVWVAPGRAAGVAGSPDHRGPGPHRPAENLAADRDLGRPGRRFTALIRQLVWREWTWMRLAGRNRERPGPVAGLPNRPLVHRAAAGDQVDQYADQGMNSTKRNHLGESGWQVMTSHLPGCELGGVIDSDRARGPGCTRLASK